MDQVHSAVDRTNRQNVKMANQRIQPTRKLAADPNVRKPMKNITFRFQKRIAAAQLVGLFEGLPASRRPPQTPATLANSQEVITAWHKGQLVGVATAGGNKVVHLAWLYVRESYRRRGIGKTLVTKLIAKFPNAQMVKIIANRAVLSFYRDCGFKVRKDAVPMMKVLEKGTS